MCPNCNWFVDYKECNLSKIFIGNDATCKIVGIGTLNIKMWDGVTLTINDVRHISVLKKNLISLGTLDSKDCVIQAKD